MSAKRNRLRDGFASTTNMLRAGKKCPIIDASYMFAVFCVGSATIIISGVASTLKKLKT
jgi:hypothetical protein